MSKEHSLQNTTRSSSGSSSIWKPNINPLPGSVQKVESLLEVEQVSQILASLSIDEPSVQITKLQSTKTNGSLSPVEFGPMSQRKNLKAPNSHSNKSAVSFQQYEESTLDAWDDGDDDLLVRLRLDPSYVQSTATQIINNYNTSASGSSPQPSFSASRAVPASAAKAPSVSKSEVSNRGGGDPAPPSQNSKRNGGAVRKSVSHAQSQRELAKEKKFETLLNSPPKNLLEELRTLSWSGIPISCRPITWRLLSGYLPAALDRRDFTLERKRKEYVGLLEQYFGTRHEEQYKEIFRQIHIDVPRMNPAIALFQTILVQEMFERILYIWAIRHPASGYVQGINDLVTPFFVVFLREFLDADVETDTIDITSLTKEELDMIEADSYWCMSKLLDGIQDNYTFAQPGIQMKVSALKELTLRIDSDLHNHIENQNIEFLQFSFRWMNNLLMRELPLRCTVRLWDTYLAEPEGFADYHLYVCAAFLTKFSKPLKKQYDFQGVMTLLQNLPTQSWGDENIGELTAEAYRLKYMFAGAPQHYKKS